MTRLDSRSPEIPISPPRQPIAISMDYSSLISKRRDRFSELEEAVGDPELFSNPKRATAILREHRQLKASLDLWERLEDTKRQLADNQELVRSGDPDFAEMAAEEIPGQEGTITALQEELQYALLPADPSEDRDALVEIRAGAGGDEASLFAAELMRMYQRYADLRGWKAEHLESSPSEVGGFKEVILKITGEQVFRYLKYESGVHRVQRVPATEAGGRIHTSAATVAVLPEAEEVDVKIDDKDVRIDVYRSSGPGGQSVNTTDSAVRITHLPSGLVVIQQDEKSQHKNKAKALKVLRTRLYEAERERLHNERAGARKSMVGSGDRSERIRTYNFPQGRVTDHRINLTLHRLPEIITGDMGELLGALSAQDEADRLAQLDG